MLIRMKKIWENTIPMLILSLITLIGSCFLFSIPTTTYASTKKSVYNVVIFIRFAGEGEYLNTKPNNINESNYSIMLNTYNRSKKSIRNYYKAVSNDNIDLESVLTTQSYRLSYPRSRYIGVPENYQYSYYREFHEELIKILQNYKFPKYTCPDSDNDKEVDSLTFVMLYNPSDKIEYSDILWEHAYSLNVRKQEGYKNDLAVKGPDGELLKNSNNDTVYYGKYNLVNLDTYTKNIIQMDSQGYHIVKNSTMAHELGHIFGMGDIYLADSSALPYEPVWAYDLMAYNHGTYDNTPMFINTHSRLKQGWIGSSNIAEITSSGTYTLQPVNYEYNKSGTSTPSNRILAYVLKSDKYPNQAIYIEYRDVGSLFDNISTKNGGLLVYRIYNTNNKALSNVDYTGKEGSSPLDIKVFRNSLYYNSTAGTAKQNVTDGSLINTTMTTMGTGKTVSRASWSGSRGTYNKYVSNAITWSSTGSDKFAEEDSHISITVKSINTSSKTITFDVDWDGEFISSEQFNNPVLEAKLKSILGKSDSDNLRVRDLSALGKNYVLDISNLGLTSLQGLNLLDLSNIKAIDASGNNINSSASLLQANRLSVSNTCKIFLQKNDIDLDKLSASEKNYIHIVYGVQGDDSCSINADTCLKMYFRQSDLEYFKVKLTLDGNSIYVTTNSVALIGGRSGVYGYTIDGTATTTKVYTGRITCIMLTISSLSVSRNGTLSISKNDVSLEGITFDKLYFDVGNASTSSVGKFNKKINVTITTPDGKKVTREYNITYSVVDRTPPTITLRGDKSVKLIVGSGYADPGVDAMDDGEPITNITIEYYKAGVKVNKIDYASVGEYIIKYIARDSAGNSASATRSISIIYSSIESYDITTPVGKITNSGSTTMTVCPVVQNASTVNFRDIIYEWYLNGEYIGKTVADIHDGSSKMDVNFVKAGQNTLMVKSNGVVLKTYEVYVNEASSVNIFGVEKIVFKIVIGIIIGAGVILILYALLTAKKKRYNKEVEEQIKWLNNK